MIGKIQYAYTCTIEKKSPLIYWMDIYLQSTVFPRSETFVKDFKTLQLCYNVIEKHEMRLFVLEIETNQFSSSINSRNLSVYDFSSLHIYLKVRDILNKLSG